MRWAAEHGVATLVVDRPPLNPLSHQTKAELLACLDEIAADPAVRCLILHGAGGRAFSVGADIKEFPDMVARREVRDHAVQEHTLYNRIDFFPIPTIAAIEGHCLGGGLELALACDLRVASETARLGLPEVKLGVFPGGGGTERLPRLIGESRARELIYTGEPVDAREAWRLGLVNRVVPAGQALAAAQELGRTIAETSGGDAAHGESGHGPRSVHGSPGGSAGLDRCHQRTVRVGGRPQPGVQAFLEKRPAKSQPDGQR